MSAKYLIKLIDKENLSIASLIHSGCNLVAYKGARAHPDPEASFDRVQLAFYNTLLDHVHGHSALSSLQHICGPQCTDLQN